MTSSSPPKTPPAPIPSIWSRYRSPCVDAGASTINLPDTVGYSIPSEHAALIGRMAKAFGDRAIVSVHCHDDLGLAVANSIAAVQAGARQVECTINGIGERAGNCSLEEIVMACKVRQELLPFETGINTEHLYPASRLLSELITFGPQPNKAIVGRERIRARSRHPPGRLPQGADDLRDHDPGRGRRAREPPGAWQAQRPPRPQRTLPGAGLTTCRSSTSIGSMTGSSASPTAARRASTTTRSSTLFARWPASSSARRRLIAGRWSRSAPGC